MKKIALFILSVAILIVILIIGIKTNKIKIDNPNNKLQGLKVENSIKNKEYNLPLIVIDTNGKKINGLDRTYATMYIYENKENYLKNNPNQIELASLKIRGNSSKEYPKKQYSIQFKTNKDEDKNVSLLGLPKGSHFALNAPFADVSLLRNYLAYTVGGDIIEYTPKAKFCEVFLVDNNSGEIKESDYMGVFLLIQKIRRSKNMVNIGKSNKNSNVTSFIIEKDRYNLEDKEINFDTYGKNTDEYRSNIINIYPKTKITKGQIKYINSYFSTFERVLYSSNFKSPTEGYAKYINVNSFVNYYIINEFFDNVDAGRYSTYYYKDYNGKLNAGPIWDFNVSLGNNYINGTYYYPYGFYMQTKSVFNRILMNKSFDEKVIARYKELRKTYLSDSYLDNLIDNEVNYLGPAVGRNFKRWPIYLCNQAEMFDMQGKEIKPYEGNINELENYMKTHKYILMPTTGKATTYNGEIENLKNYIKERGAWMDANINSLMKLSSGGDN